MDRKKNLDKQSLSTKERILKTATAMFAKESYDSVSMRDLAEAVNLNPASIYNHFSGKAKILDEVFKNMENQLTAPSFVLRIDDNLFESETFDLATFFINGGKEFYKRSRNEEMLNTWKILLTHQYKHKAAMEKTKSIILEAPVLYFTSIFDYFKKKEIICKELGSNTLASILSSIFFECSFRSALDFVWDENDDDSFIYLEEQVRVFCTLIENYRNV